MLPCGNKEICTKPNTNKVLPRLLVETTRLSSRQPAERLAATHFGSSGHSPQSDSADLPRAQIAHGASPSRVTGASAACLSSQRVRSSTAGSGCNKQYVSQKRSSSGFQRAADELWPRREACAVSDEDMRTAVVALTGACNLSKEILPWFGHSQDADTTSV